MEASRDPALFPHKRSVVVTVETDQADGQIKTKPKQKRSTDAGETVKLLKAIDLLLSYIQFE